VEAIQYQQNVQNALDGAGVGTHAWAELGNLDGNNHIDPGEYPAAPVSWSSITGGYNTSVFTGVTELISSLNHRYTLGPIGMGCVSETVVLGGYSQGADVLGWALALTEPGVFGLPALTPEARSHIGFVALYGDPKFNVACGQNRPWVRANARCASFPRLGARSPYLPSDFLSRTGSWCDDGDGICAVNDWTIGIGNHTTVYRDSWIQQSAAEIAAAARLKQCSLVLSCSSGGTSAPPPPPSNYTNDRTVLHGSDGSLWVMAGGAKFYFGSMTEFYNLGYSTSGMAEVSTATLNAIPTVPRNGTVLRSGGGQIYIVAGSAKFPVGSMTEYYNQGYVNNQWINVPQTPLDAIGDVPGNKPTDGTVIQSPIGALSVVVGGVKFQFGSMTEYHNLGYADTQIVRVTAAADTLANASTATPAGNGTVLRSGGGQLYVVTGGSKFYFGSMTEYYNQGYSDWARFNVPQGPLNAIGDAPGNMPGNGTVVHRPDGAIFVIAGGVRWHFGSMTELANLGYSTFTRVSQAPLDGIYDASSSHLPANETVVQGTDSTLWVMKSGVRRSFTSMTQFTGMGYTTSQIIRVPDAVLNGLPSGGNLP